MNRTLTFAAICLMAAPLFAADPKPVSNPTQQPAQGDSPLVAAAKRSGRLGKKPAFVITNENLVTTGGHITTTSSQDNLHINAYPPSTIPTTNPQQQTHAMTEQAKARKTEEERQKVVKQLQMQYEGESLNADQDPARMEHQMQQLQVQQPETKKP